VQTFPAVKFERAPNRIRPATLRAGASDASPRSSRCHNRSMFEERPCQRHGDRILNGSCREWIHPSGLQSIATRDAPSGCSPWRKRRRSSALKPT